MAAAKYRVRGFPELGRRCRSLLYDVERRAQAERVKNELRPGYNFTASREQEVAAGAAFHLREALRCLEKVGG